MEPIVNTGDRVVITLDGKFLDYNWQILSGHPDRLSRAGSCGTDLGALLEDCQRRAELLLGHL